MKNEQIKELALANGFKLKEQPNGAMDLNPYVYEFAAALLKTQDHYVKSAKISAPLAQSRLYQIIDMQAEIDALKAQVAELEKPEVCVYSKTNSPTVFKSACGQNHLAHQVRDFCPNCGGKVEVQDGL